MFVNGDTTSYLPLIAEPISQRSGWFLFFYFFFVSFDFFSGLFFFWSQCKGLRILSIAIGSSGPVLGFLASGCPSISLLTAKTFPALYLLSRMTWNLFLLYSSSVKIYSSSKLVTPSASLMTANRFCSSDSNFRGRWAFLRLVQHFSGPRTIFPQSCIGCIDSDCLGTN